MEHVNVVLVGAGISGLGMAHHLKAQCPEKTFLILEQKATHGGTWALHKYPG
ncbi:MAG: NAD(P)-binding protein, partial [Pseudomonadota bacterium]